MSGLIQDVRAARRSLARAPGFTLVALITLALGLGGTTAIFSVVDGVLLRPLPYPEPAAVVSVVATTRHHPDGGAFSPADYLDYRRASRSFASLAAYREDLADLTGIGEPLRLSGLETTAGFFDVLGVPALVGRTYSEATDGPDGPRLAVLSESVWRQQFGADRDIPGRAVRLNGVPFTIAGVMPAFVEHPVDAGIWMLAPAAVPTPPMPISGDVVAERELSYFQAIGRLKPGLTVAQANSDLGGIAEQLAATHPDTNSGERARVLPYQEVLIGDVRVALLMLMGAVAFVLLIACANVASLVLARGAGRRRELAVRAALGAGRGRLVRQLLTESLLLALAGGLLGLVVASWGVDALLALAPESIPRLSDVRLDWRVMWFAVLSSTAAGVLFGLVPALQAARADVSETLKDGGRTGSARMRTQKVLVVAEVALALVLLIGAGLMLASFARLRAVDPGFVVEHLVAVQVPLPQTRYSPADQRRFYAELSARLRDTPATRRSALAFPAPLGDAGASGGYAIEGAPPQLRSERRAAEFSSITPGYFQTLGIPLLRGRDVEPGDTRERPGVALINQAMAEREWPDQDPLGQRLTLGSKPDADDWLTIIGVVGNAKRQDLQTAMLPAIYIPHTRFTLPFMTVVVRSDAGESAVASAVAQVVRTLDADLPITEVATIDRLIEQATGQPRFRALLVGTFAAAALLLSAVGLYGLISYAVAQRVPEIGVRLALGATPAEIGRLLLGDGLVLAGIGVTLGLVGALALARLLEGLLFSISATDPLVYASLAGVLLAVAAAACSVPARRAMRIDPLAALRTE